MVMQLVEDAKKREVVHKQLRNVQDKATGLINSIEATVCDAIMMAADASEKRLKETAEYKEISMQRIRSDLADGKLMRAGIDDLGNIGARLNNRVEEKAGAIGRLMLHTTMRMNQWWIDPVTGVVSKVGGDLVTLADQGIMGISGLLNGSRDEINRIELLLADTSVWAREVINRESARIAEGRVHVSDQVKSTLELAEEKLQLVTKQLTPGANELRDRINAVLAAMVSKGESTRKYSKLAFENLFKAYGKTKDITEHTISYLQATNKTMIPGDVLVFFKKLVGSEPRDVAFNESIKDVQELIEMLSKVLD